ncbi:MAG TPA: FtsX-like permease family protein [Phnomibacter sp.]|nr:FtsX-like permease family protein [Phnomibacter sp.]
MSLTFAWRYLRSKKSTNAINIIAWISMVAIGVVTAALVVVLSVFNGFEDLVKRMYGDFYADLEVTARQGIWMYPEDGTWEKLKNIPGVLGVCPVVEQRAILLDQDDKSIVWLKGVEPDYADHTGLVHNMVRGIFDVGDSAAPRLVIGVGVEHSLKIIAGQTPFPITVYLPNPDAGPSADALTAMVSANAYPGGSFAVQQEFDDQYAFTHIGFLRYMQGIEQGACTAIEIFLAPGASMTQVQKKVQQVMGSDLLVKNRYEQDQALFAAMKTEKLIIYAIAFLILIIAGFNIVSSLTMTVIEKQKDIAVLRAMGASDGVIYRIFLQLGILLASLGAAAGFIIGLVICLGQQKFHWIKLGGQSFIIDHYPVAVQVSDLLTIGGIVTCMALLAAWLPSRRAANAYYSLR